MGSCASSSQPPSPSGLSSSSPKKKVVISAPTEAVNPPRKAKEGELVTTEVGHNYWLERRSVGDVEGTLADTAILSVRRPKKHSTELVSVPLRVKKRSVDGKEVFVMRRGRSVHEFSTTADAADYISNTAHAAVPSTMLAGWDEEDLAGSSGRSSLSK